MNLKEIEKLIELFSQKDISKLAIKEGDFELALEKNSNHSPIVSQNPITTQIVQSQPQIVNTPNEVATNDEHGIFIQSPMVGTFYQCPAPNSAPYVNVGDKVKKGQIIGIIEAMKIMNEVEAEFDCKVIEIVANDAQPVEFGSKLIKVEKI